MNPFRRFILAGLCLAALFSGFAPHTGAFVANFNPAGQPLRWNLDTADPDVPASSVNPVTRAIRFHLGSQGWSTSNRVAELNAVRASFAQWQAIPGTKLRFEEGALLDGALDVNTTDGTNIVFWTRNTTVVNGGLDNIAGRLAVTFVDFFEDHTLVEADMAINGVEFRWFTQFDQGRKPEDTFFVEGVVTHEIGHWIGLDHSPVGAATMMWRGVSGLGLQAGLAADDIAGARFLYALPDTASSLGRITGRVTLAGRGVFGAVVLAEDSHGNIANGTVARADGQFELASLAPGSYEVRAAPLDPQGSGIFLIRGREISAEFEAAETAFGPSPAVPLAVVAGITASANLSVTAGAAPFRIAYMREPSSNVTNYDYYSAPVALRPGDSNLIVGVLSPTLPLGALQPQFAIPGTGLDVGAPFYGFSRFGDRGIFAQVNVRPDAAPGLRSFRVTLGESIAYANGFLEILPVVTDYDFDGFDDIFQRRYWDPFTLAQADPGADPDQDGFINRQEATAGSVPTDASSVGFVIDSVRLAAAGATVTWQAAPGRRFQLHGRDTVAGAPWVKIGPAVTATARTASQLDPNANGQFRFYRVELLP